MTLRELLWMVEGAQRERWDHTACLRADLQAPWTKERIRPADFHPFLRRRARKVRTRPGAVEALARDLCGDEACDAAWKPKEETHAVSERNPSG